MTSTLDLEGISFVYPKGLSAIDHIDIHVARGEIVTVVGPSGSGKTTLLKVIAGLERPTSGRVLLDGIDETRTAPGDRDVAVVFQGATLYPHLSVAANLAFGLKVRGVPRALRRARTYEMATRLGIDGVLNRKPATLSGGQARRVALGRALVRRPRLFLLDEPLDGLDLPLRRELREVIRNLQDSFGVTTILVTHDQEEALALGDRVCVLESGQIRQVGTPEEVYHRPADAFVAQFIGLLPMNLLHGTLRRGPEGIAIETAGASVRVPRGWEDALHDHGSSRVILGIRPEDAALGAPGGSDPSELCLRGHLDRLEMLGGQRVAYLRLRSAERLVSTVSRDVAPPSQGGDVSIRLNLARAHAFSAEGGGRNLTLGRA